MKKCNLSIHLLAVILIGLHFVNACDKSGCTPTPSHYDELGCTAILDDENCCPIRYSCPEREPDAQGCQYRGKIYEVGETISDQFLPKRCHEECTCEHWNDKSTYQFSCRAISREDAEIYTAKNVLQRKTDTHLNFATTSPIERCHGIVITDTNTIVKAKKVKCVYDGAIYSKGQRIRPDGRCFECICDEKMKTQDLDLHIPQCQRKLCGIGTSGLEHDYLNRGCVPVYDKTATTCCPIDWRCPTSNDVVKKSGIISDSSMKCQFGDFTLGLLDHVLYEDGGDKLNCKCYTPPMVHCLKN